MVPLDTVVPLNVLFACAAVTINVNILIIIGHLNELTFAFCVQRRFDRTVVNDVTFDTADSIGTIQFPPDVNESWSDSINPNVLHFPHVFIINDRTGGPQHTTTAVKCVGRNCKLKDFVFFDILNCRQGVVWDDHPIEHTLNTRIIKYVPSKLKFYYLRCTDTVCLCRCCIKISYSLWCTGSATIWGLPRTIHIYRHWVRLWWSSGVPLSLETYKLSIIIQKSSEHRTVYLFGDINDRPTSRRPVYIFRPNAKRVALRYGQIFELRVSIG